MIEGYARIGLMNAFVGEAVFMEEDHARLAVGSDGLKGLLAYLGPKPDPALLENLGRTSAEFPIRPFSPAPYNHRAKADPARSTEVQV